MPPCIYSFTGTMMFIGTSAMIYGIHTFSFPMFIEGFFLLWLGFSLTATAIDVHRLENDG